MMYSLASSVRIYCRAVLRGLPGGWRQSRRNVGSACCHTPWQGSAHTKTPVESLSPGSFSASLHSHTANPSQALQRRLQWTFHTLSSTTWWRFKKEYYSAANLWVKKSLLQKTALTSFPVLQQLEVKLQNFCDRKKKCGCYITFWLSIICLTR